MSEILRTLEMLIIVILVFLVFLRGAVSVAKAVIGNDRLEFKDKIEPHQSGAQFNKAMMGNDPIELEIKPHHSGDAVQ